MRHVALTLLSVLAAGLLASIAVAEGTERLGEVNFSVSCTEAAQREFTRGVAFLHSFWWKNARDAFESVLTADPSCAIAHWGLALVWLDNPLSRPPDQNALTLGAATVEKGRTLGAKTPRETDYLNAIGVFYKNWDKLDHRTRALAYERAMEALTQRYPDDREARVFYALSLNMTALPIDKTYANQLKAASILEKVFAEQPQHPGVAHYLIHTYDYPPIAHRGLDAARRYAAIAPDAPHALHMPAHVFTRVGAWQESVDSNRASAAAARRSGSVNEVLHAMDYQMYGYLQMAQDREARRLLDEIAGLPPAPAGSPSYTFASAAIPARYALERGAWGTAASLEVRQSQVPWADSVTHFARAIGSARSGKADAAQKDVERLEALRDALTKAGNAYWAEQVDIQRLAAMAWIARARGQNDEAVKLLRQAADREDATEKNVVTPGPILPAREMLGDMLLEIGRAAEALREFEASMVKEPNRFGNTAGAARAAEQAGDPAKARQHYQKLLVIAERADSERPEIRQAKAFVAR